MKDVAQNRRAGSGSQVQPSLHDFPSTAHSEGGTLPGTWRPPVD